MQAMKDFHGVIHGIRTHTFHFRKAAPTAEITDEKTLRQLLPAVSHWHWEKEERDHEKREAYTSLVVS
jgi:hypothetical protein